MHLFICAIYMMVVKLSGEPDGTHLRFLKGKTRLDTSPSMDIDRSHDISPLVSSLKSGNITIELCQIRLDRTSVSGSESMTCMYDVAP